MNVLVTGCAGFIGSNVASKLLDQGHAVLGVDSLPGSPGGRLREWRPDRLMRRPGFAFHRIDISDMQPLRSFLRDVHRSSPVSAMFSLGALAGVRGSVANPHDYYETNVLGTLNLLELCREFGTGEFILASTSSVYGAEVDGPVREDAPASRPLSPYAASKKAAETLLHSYHHLYGIDVVTLRYFTVCGPAGRPDMSTLRFICNVAEGEPITLLGDGKQQRDFTYVDDIARGTAAALSVTGYEVINLDYGEPVALIDEQSPEAVVPFYKFDVHSKYAYRVHLREHRVDTVRSQSAEHVQVKTDEQRC